MLKMIIVDDERKIRESMKRCVDWAGLDVELIGLCKNGLEAYDMILDESPDIVLTDIMMPALSGLELIKRITQSGQQIEFIILSGYGEFSYTKEAMKYGITRYLLKPCDEEELEEVVRDAVKARYAWKESQMKDEKNARLLSHYKENLFQNFLLECLSDGPNHLLGIYTNAQYQNFFNEKYEMVCIKTGQPADLQKVCDYVEGWKKERAAGIFSYSIFSQDMLILFLENLKPMDQEQMEQMRRYLPDGWRHVKHKSIAGLEEIVLEIKGTLAGAGVIYYWNSERWVEQKISETDYSVINKLKEKINANIPQEELLEEFERIIDKEKELADLKMIINHIFIMMIQTNREIQIRYKILEYLTELEECRDIGQVRESGRQTFEMMLRDQRKVYTGKDFIDQTIRYVDEHLSDPQLSLKLIAESELFMNVDYLSKQFLRYVGCKFSAFLAQKRIDEAKRIMAANTEVSVQQVADAVGCGNNPQYFSLLFKKQQGMTATDYLKQIRGGK